MFSQYGNLNLQNQLNSYSWEIDLYNDFVLFIQLLICTVLLLFLFFCFISKWQKNFLHWEMLEIFWSVIPAFILIFLGFPTIKMLYSMESFSFQTFFSVKVSGHQWYWEYSYPEFKLKIESFPLLLSKIFRGAETTSSLILPLFFNLRIIVTSNDVLHSWTIPNLGVKMDACPGRLNFFLMKVNKPGIYVGQCSELCGNFHHLMPIYVETVAMSMLTQWFKMK